MGAYRASTLIDFERGQPLELESMFLEPLRQAQTAGVPVPRLVRLCEVLASIGSVALTHEQRHVLHFHPCSSVFIRG